MDLIVKKTFELLVIGSAVFGAVGCSSYQDAIEGQKVAYRKAEKREVGLEVPPDLTAQSADEQFLIPGESGSGAVSASSFYSGKNKGGVATATTAKSEPVLAQSDDIQIKQNGKIRSLVVQNMPPEQLWPVLKSFWQENGFDLGIDDPRIGLMETNWAENRAAIPVDGIRKVIGKVFDGLYSSNQRDRYRTRVEQLQNGVEIFVSHRGMEENYTDKSQTTMAWMNRPADPELEAEMLNRLLVKLTGDQQAAAKKGVETGTQLITVKLEQTGSSLVLAEDFPQAWRRVGFGLDRAGFIIEDRDRANGLYYVKYMPDSAAADSQKKGFFGKMFSFGSDKSIISDQRFQVSVAPSSSASTVVKFNNERGEALDSKLSADAVNKLASKLQ